jgi:IS30 family transposase
MYEFEGVSYASESRMRAARKERYFQLLLGGMTSMAAARKVGISKRSAIRWRIDDQKTRTGALPLTLRYGVQMDMKTKDRYFLTETDRLTIADGLINKVPVRHIAHALGRNPSTVYREIARGKGTDGLYHPHQAHHEALMRFKRPKARKVDKDPRLWPYILKRLKVNWSPEQISASLRDDFAYDEGMQLSHETIYQAIFIQAKGPLKDELKACMRQGRCARKRQGRTPKERFREPMVMISERPPEVEDRAIPGHWEGDLIVGAYGKSAIGTLVERTTRFCILLYLPFDHTAPSVQDAVTRKMVTLPAQLRLSLTWDQGMEMALHKRIAEECDMAVYFCDPHSPWQRGSNENTNGLLRQYFPKGTDLSVFSEPELDAVAAELNGRIRKTLSWKSPAECFNALLEAA